MTDFPFMHWYTADYARDTKHLTLEQDCAYRRMIDAMWDAGGRLPNDAAELARVLRIDVRKWKFLSPAVLAFFEVEGDDLTHKRITIELAKARARSERSAAAGRKGGRPKKTSAEPTKPNGPAGVSSRNHRGFRGETPRGSTADLSGETAENKETRKATAKPARARLSESESESNLPSLSASSPKPETVSTSSDQPPPLRFDGGAAADPLVWKPPTFGAEFHKNGPTISREQIAANAAMIRLDAALVAAGREFHERVIDRDDVYAAGVNAEIANPGAGLQQCIAMLDEDSPFKFAISGNAPGRKWVEPEITWTLQ